MDRVEQYIEEFLGRERTEFSWKVLEKLCHILCTKEEILAIFSCSDSQLEQKIRDKHNQTFQEYYAEHSAKGKMSIRRAQLKKAFAGDGDATMLKFLGQNVLKQTEYHQMTLPEIPIKLVYSNHDEKQE